MCNRQQETTLFNNKCAYCISARPAVTQQPLFHKQRGSTISPGTSPVPGTFTHAEKVGLCGTQGEKWGPGDIPQLVPEQ